MPRQQYCRDMCNFLLWSSCYQLMLTIPLSQDMWSEIHQQTNHIEPETEYELTTASEFFGNITRASIAVQGIVYNPNYEYINWGAPREYTTWTNNKQVPLNDTKYHGQLVSQMMDRIQFPMNWMMYAFPLNKMHYIVWKLVIHPHQSISRAKDFSDCKVSKFLWMLSTAQKTFHCVGTNDVYLRYIPRHSDYWPHSSHVIVWHGISICSPSFTADFFQISWNISLCSFEIW